MASPRTTVPDRTPSPFRAVRDTAGAVGGAVLGLAPHVLHHVGLVAGTAFVVGAGGNALFYLLGLLLSVPMIRRIYRRFGTWLAPVLAVAIFTATFLVSAYLVGPAITSERPEAPPDNTPATQQHPEHH